MQTHLLPDHENLALADAEQALRACVHCGFCNAVCPTYQLLGDEADGPRGRIYLIKGVLEGVVRPVDARPHLDRCLTCRACEALCPSDVPYGRLLEIGRSATERSRPWFATLIRRVLQATVPYRDRAGPLWRLGRAFKPLLTPRLQRILGSAARHPVHPAAGTRLGILFTGCVQDSARPGINQAAARVLAALGWRLAPDAGGCCGALDQHLTDLERARTRMRANVDAWYPLIAQGLEAIIVTASGCAVSLREYAQHLQDDALYADKARAIAARIRDISECVRAEDMPRLGLQSDPRHYALHRPCTLEFPVTLGPQLESLLTAAGFALMATTADLACCGSAGSYSLLQPDLAQRLQQRKLTALTTARPDAILTANIGCLLHLQAGTHLPVHHWIEVLAERLPATTEPALTSG